MQNSTVDLINNKLKEYGTNLYGEPIFRVVFSDEQIEKRRGTFNDYSGKLFVRTITEVREVKKYPWINRKWILERWASGSMAYHRDLETNKNGVYVCVYVFQDIDCNYLPPLLKVCEIVINHLLNPLKREEALERDLKAEQKEKEIEENYYLEKLKIESDEAATKDKNSYRESSSIGYTETFEEKQEKEEKERRSE